MDAQLLPIDTPALSFVRVSRQAAVLTAIDQPGVDVVCWVPSYPAQTLEMFNRLAVLPKLDMHFSAAQRGVRDAAGLTQLAVQAGLLGPLGAENSDQGMAAVYDDLTQAAQLYHSKGGQWGDLIMRRTPGYSYPFSFPLGHYDEDSNLTLIANFSPLGTYIMDTRGLDEAQLMREGKMQRFGDGAKFASPTYDALDGRVYELPAPSFTILRSEKVLHDWNHKNAAVRCTLVA